MVFWALLICVAVVAAIAWRQWHSQRSTYRPLSSRQPGRTSAQTNDVPLGMEATDLDHVNRVNRRNESLERGHTNWTRRGPGFTQASETDVQPLADDETYARRFYALFQRDNKRTPKDD